MPRCPICGGEARQYGFVVGDERFDECRDCGLLLHSAGLAADPAERRTASDDPELVAALLSLVERYVATGDRTVEIAGAPSPLLLEEARRRGFVPAFVGGEGASTRSAVVIALDVVENAPEPVEYLASLRERVRDGGALVVVSRQLRKPGPQGEGGRVLDPRQRYSMSDTNLQTALWMAGFRDVYLSRHVPAGDRVRSQRWFQDQVIALSRMGERRDVPRLSVIVPVFNEAGTVRQVLDTLAAKEMPGVELEIVVVESDSTDGSRDIVRAYEGRPRFRVVLEERPRGKGFAVRTGFRHATGDVLLIQDADLEYDFLDYEMLVRPIVRGMTPFVLGTRHAGHWKIRKFAQQFLLADLMNLAHWGLVELANQLYGQAMTDPVTMFKVFRADCLSGLTFECNRFDFDWELVCKLLRKGYRPLEIPVNYQSRSFEEGKKVRMFRDPPTWIRAMLKYRWSSVHQLPSPPQAVGAAVPRAAASSVP